MRCADCIAESGGNSFDDPNHHENCKVCNPAYILWRERLKDEPPIGPYHPDWNFNRANE